MKMTRPLKSRLRNVLYAASMSTFILASCSEDTEVPSTSRKVELITTIESNADSRISMEENGKGYFTEGDVISLYINGNFNKDLTFQSNTWTPELNWDEIGNSQTSFLSYYPANPFVFMNGSTTFSIATNQVEKGDYESSDLLIAKTTAAPGEPVLLNYKHALSRVTVQLSSNVFTTEQLADAKLAVSTFTRTKIDTRTGTLSNYYRDLKDAKDVAMQNIGEGRYKAVLLPQNLSNVYDWTEKRWITIRIADKEFAYKVPKTLNDGQPFTDLEGGKEVTFNITLNKKGTDPSPEPDPEENEWSGKIHWVYGLKNIPEIDQWGYAYTIPYKIRGLEWRPEYGWYDCTKKDPVNGTYNDSHLCWAAAASNMIYWWLDRNQANLERYGYDGPRDYTSALDCEVFQFFKDHYPNQGYFTQKGLEWFFIGKTYSADINNQPTGNHPGFFKKLFKDRLPFRMGSGIYLSDDLKTAFKNHEAIGLNIVLQAGKAAHAISVWGAEFNKDGEASVLYISENNNVDLLTNGTSPMQPGKLCPTGIYPKKVKKDQNGVFWMESSVEGRYTIEVRDLIYLGTHEKEWQEYFAKNPSLK